MKEIKLQGGQILPLEMHKVRIVQKLNLPKGRDRLKAIEDAGFNTFLLANRDVFLDMLTDSGVNAMSDNQQSAMMRADDSYAGSETFFRLHDSIKKLFGEGFFLPAHQGRACENIICKAMVGKNQTVPMNYHFTTTKSHIMLNGGEVVEIPVDEAFELTSTCPFKGNIDSKKLKALIKEKGRNSIAFIRMEAGTNLIGGQPFSLENYREISEIANSENLPLVLDASLLGDNLHFMKMRDPSCKAMSIQEITQEIGKLSDLIYFSGRKLGSARGGAIITTREDLFKKMQGLVPLFEGFLTYGGMSVREMEAMAVGLEETLDEDVISQGPMFINFMTEKLLEKSIPVITPSGGLGCHLNAMDFLSHIPQEEYPAGALAAALYLISGIRGMERGTISEQRNPDGSEPLANMELLRLAMPRRVFTMSQVLYGVDRIKWLFENRDLVGGLEWSEEPDILRFFFGKLKAKTDWPQKLLAKFEEDFGFEM